MVAVVVAVAEHMLAVESVAAEIGNTDGKRADADVRDEHDANWVWVVVDNKMAGKHWLAEAVAATKCNCCCSVGCRCCLHC